LLGFFCFAFTDFGSLILPGFKLGIFYGMWMTQIRQYIDFIGFLNLIKGMCRISEFMKSRIYRKQEDY